MVRFVDNNTILGGLFDLGDDNGTFVTMRLVEFDELLEGKFASDVGV